MKRNDGLLHWDNSWIKTAAIVMLCALKNEVYLVGCDDNKEIATFQTKKRAECLHFAKLATTPAYAGKGVGTFCMKAIEQLAVQQDCKKVCCEVYDKSVHAITFYTNKGYQVSGECSSIKYRQLQLEKTVGEET